MLLETGGLPAAATTDYWPPGEPYDEGWSWSGKSASLLLPGSKVAKRTVEIFHFDYAETSGPITNPLPPPPSTRTPLPSNVVERIIRAGSGDGCDSLVSHQQRKARQKDLLSFCLVNQMWWEHASVCLWRDLYLEERNDAVVRKLKEYRRYFFLHEDEDSMVIPLVDRISFGRVKNSGQIKLWQADEVRGALDLLASSAREARIANCEDLNLGETFLECTPHLQALHLFHSGRFTPQTNLTLTSPINDIALPNLTRLTLIEVPVIDIVTVFKADEGALPSLRDLVVVRPRSGHSSHPSSIISFESPISKHLQRLVLGQGFRLAFYPGRLTDFTNLRTLIISVSEDVQPKTSPLKSLKNLPPALQNLIAPVVRTNEVEVFSVLKNSPDILPSLKELSIVSTVPRLGEERNRVREKILDVCERRGWKFVEGSEAEWGQGETLDRDVEAYFGPIGQ
ncbi:hypothetical protein P7C70_g5265, partial [Phenoliferia sp. Uapishka_3]